MAIASGGGRVGEHSAQQLVAAGLTLLQRSAPLVRALHGRRAAILLPTSPAFLTALAACEGRGAVLVNPLAAPAEINHQLQDGNVGAVLTNAALASRLPEGITRVLLDDAPRSATVLANGMARTVDLGSHFGLDLAGEHDAPGSSEEAVVVYTSAMKGSPLGAVLTHRNLIHNARSTIEATQLTADDHMLALLPFSHLFGLTVSGSAPLMAGARVTTMPRFNSARALQLLGGGITAVVGVPAVFHALVGVLERSDATLDGRLRLAVCGGAMLPLHLQERWHARTGVELRQGYGLTEAGPVCLFNDSRAANARRTVGSPLPGVDVRICRPVASENDATSRGAPPAAEGEPEPLPDGVEGEICVRGPNVSPGYVSRGADGLLVQRGWLRTGDQGVRDSSGTVTFTGILKPMFTRSGFNVYPREIERAILEMPGVRDVGVRAVPNAFRENDITVMVRGSVAGEAVREWCERRLASYKQPSSVEIVA